MKLKANIIKHTETCKNDNNNNIVSVNHNDENKSMTNELIP